MLETLLFDGMRELGLDPAREGAGKLVPYLKMMLERNLSLNLTAVKDPVEAVRLHLLDSLAIFTQMDLAGKRVLDVGTGGGMPGVAIALYEPTAQVTMLDATAKKLAFIREACETLNLYPDFVNLRAEEYARTEARERYDVVTARAVAALPVLCELCLPLVRPGGVFAAYKGSMAQEELDASRRAVRTLGGDTPQLAMYRIPGSDAERSLILIKKVAQTPAQYPRAYAQIKKKPL